MTVFAEAMLGLRVADVMSARPITVSANASMSEAAEVLVSQGIGGAPVVDEMGRCVGVLSAMDFAGSDQLCGCTDTDIASDADHVVVQSSRQTPLHIKWVRGDSVRQHMQSALQTVSDQLSIVDAARIMCSEHVHRLIVLDESSHPIGIVSSLDLLGAVVHQVKSDLSKAPNVKGPVK